MNSNTNLLRAMVTIVAFGCIWDLYHPNVARFQTDGPDVDGDAFGQAVDCVDYNGEINPSAQEICDGIDNNCDGLIDAEDYDAVLTDYCLDGNHDGRCDKTANDGVHVISACTMPDNATLQAIVAMSGGDASRIDSYIKVPDEGDTASIF